MCSVCAPVVISLDEQIESVMRARLPLLPIGSPPGLELPTGLQVPARLPPGLFSPSESGASPAANQRHDDIKGADDVQGGQFKNVCITQMIAEGSDNRLTDGQSKYDDAPGVVAA